MNGEWRLLLSLLAVLAVAHLGCHALARGLRLRPSRWSGLAASVLALGLLLPWILGDKVSLPTGVLAGVLPEHTVTKPEAA